MTIEFRSAATKVDNTNPTSSIVVDKPTGVLEGDLLIACIAPGIKTGGGTRVVTPPSGWTLIQESAVPFANGQVYYKVATGSEPATYTFTWTQEARKAAAAILAYHGQSASPINASSEGTWTTQTTPDIPSVTPTVTQSLVLACAFIDRDDDDTTLPHSPPAGHTQRVAIETALSASNSVGLNVSDKTFPSAAATGIAELTIADTRPGYGVRVALDSGLGAGGARIVVVV